MRRIGLVTAIAALGLLAASAFAGSAQAQQDPGPVAYDSAMKGKKELVRLAMKKPSTHPTPIASTVNPTLRISFPRFLRKVKCATGREGEGDMRGFLFSDGDGERSLRQTEKRNRKKIQNYAGKRELNERTTNERMNESH